MNIVNTRGTKEQKTKEKLPKKPDVPVKEIDLETPDHSIEGRSKNDGIYTYAECRRTRNEDNSHQQAIEKRPLTTHRKR